MSSAQAIISALRAKILNDSQTFAKVSRHTHYYPVKYYTETL